MSDLLNIGMSGLHAAKTNLSVTGHNITNINTPGYTRQDTVQATRIPQYTGAGYIGSGTSLVDVRRSYNEFLTTQLRSSTALSSDVQAYKSQIEQLDALLAGSTTGINPSLQAFFSATQTAAEDPSNIPARQLVIAEAEGLARRFNNIYDNISSQNSFINKQLVASTDQINQLAQTVGSLNAAIASAGTNGQQPNDLLDARDEAVRQLSTYIGVTVVVQDDNSFNLSIGSGQPLVVGSVVNQIQAVQGRGDPNTFDIDFVSGGSRQNITDSISGGEVGGLLRYRTDVLDPTINAIGRLAISVADEVNSQLGQGLDLKGQVGADLFKDINDPKMAALRVRPMANNASNASGSMDITNSKLFTTSDYRLDFDSAGAPTARRLSDGAAMVVTQDPSSGEYSFADSAGRDQGFSVKITGTPVAGDRFVLEPTRRGAADISAELKQADQLAFAAPFKSDAALQNKGNGAISQPSLDTVMGPAGASGADLNLANLEAIGSLSMRYDEASSAMVFATPLPAGVTVTPLVADGQTVAGGVTPGQNNQLKYTISVDVGGVQQSFTVSQTISGRPQDGDTFTVGFNKNGVSDNRNALKLVDLQNKQVVGVDANVTGISTGVSFNEGYGEMVERVGTLTAQARRDDVATGAILKQSTDNRDSLSAVNLDEEAENLIQFEQYYNASAQIIQVARSLFDTLINTLR
ncbi:flagellar hook-associated protein FlgK [Denitrificimonas caeni]|uniref:flagellar hook-associated protein FlgK n=1 Tax=Denitrificimonas caeni TaxID=521720 RepID=UPI0019632BB4|nr:flagellar hook-associated protein FlgK [Denitrificimonas caeni]